MRDKYQFYAAKMAELRARRASNRPLQNQLDELLAFVMSCEVRWDPDFGDKDRSLPDV